MYISLNLHLEITQYIKTMLLPVVLYGCKTWSLTLRVEHRLRVFENRVLRRIFHPKINEVTGDLTVDRCSLFLWDISAA
jgi:hypothetical protein